jgi:hypothetical protein
MKERQKVEQAQRQEELDFKRALELSKSESLKQQTPLKTLISDCSSGGISEAQLNKMSEEDMILFAINQSAVEAETFDVNGSFKTEEKVVNESNRFSLDAEFMLDSVSDDSQDDGLKYSESESEGVKNLTALKKPVLGKKLDDFGDVLEHSESYSEAAETEFLVKDGRPTSPPDTNNSDSDKDDSNSGDRRLSCGGGAGDNSHSVNGADSNAGKCVQNVTVKMPNADGDASYFAGDMDDSVLLENDEFSDQHHNGAKQDGGIEVVVLSSAEDEDPLVDSRKSMQKDESESQNDSTPERLIVSHMGHTYSRSENKKRQVNIEDALRRSSFSACKPKPKSFQSTFSACKPKHMSFQSTFRAFDEIDGISSSRKKEPEGSFGRPELSDDEKDDRWRSLQSYTKKSSGSAVKSKSGSTKSHKGVDHDEVDLSCEYFFCCLMCEQGRTLRFPVARTRHVSDHVSTNCRGSLMQ